MKCSRCGEEYSGPVCPVCGAQEPEQEPPAEKEDSLFSTSQPGSEDTDTAAQPEPPSGKKKKRKGKRAIVAVVIVLVVLLASAVCLFTFGKGFLSKVLPGYFGEASADLSSTGSSGISQSQGKTWDDIWASSAATVSERNDNAAQAAAQRQAEEEARRQAEEEARRQAEAEAQRQAEEEARRQEEQQMQELQERMANAEDLTTASILMTTALETNAEVIQDPTADMLSAKYDMEQAVERTNQVIDYFNEHSEALAIMDGGNGLYDSFLNNINAAADDLNTAIGYYNAGDYVTMYQYLKYCAEKRAEAVTYSIQMQQNGKAYIDETERMAEELLD